MLPSGTHADRGLAELMKLISGRQIASVHVWSEGAHGPMPAKVVTSMQFDKTFGDLFPD